MKLQRLVESKEALQNLAKGLLPIGVAWDLKGFIKKVEPELTIFEEIRTQKIMELGEVIPEGGYRVKPENTQEYFKAIGELFEREVEIIIPSIKIEVLKNFKDKDGNEIKMSTNDLIVLDWLIIE